MNNFKTIDTSIYYIGSAYHKNSKGEECNANEVIDSEDICKLAADTMALNYNGRKNLNSRPAGCYWSSSNAFYNYPTTASANAAYADNRGGICWSKGIRFMVMLLKSWTQYFKPI